MAKRRVKLAAARGRKSPQRTPRASRAPARRKVRSPRSQTLPGMEQVRDQRLDNICESIVDERAVMNAAKLEEGKLLKKALERMHDTNKLVYIHGEMELTRIPGEERLRARLLKHKSHDDEAEIGGDAEEAAADLGSNDRGDEAEDAVSIEP